MSRRLFLGNFVAMASLLLIAPLRAADWHTGTYTYDLSGNITEGRLGGFLGNRVLVNFQVGKRIIDVSAREYH